MTIYSLMRERTVGEESSNEVIASSEDLLTELLLRLPVKSLLKFRSVCKHWLALITDPDFIRRRNLESKTVSALYFHGWSSEYGGCYEFVPLDASQRRATFDYLKFAGSNIVESCKGLLLCRILREDRKYLVYNPSTKQLKTLPPIRAGNRVLGVSLAFDPSISHSSYKVVCIKAPMSSRNGCQVFIYSSQSLCGRWRVAGPPFNVPLHVEFAEGGVYWSGAIHWYSWTDASLYFDLDQGLAREMPMPPPLEEDSNLERLRYFGESFGHLHLVDSYGAYLTTGLNVYEMERDRSGWFVKFRLDEDVLASSLMPSYRTTVVCVVRGEKEEDSFLVVHNYDGINPNNVKLIRYNFIRQTHEVVCDNGLRGIHHWLPVYQYIESLSFV